MNKDMSNISKPITVLREDFISNILTLCNSSELPFFVIEDILKALIPEIHNGSIKQYKADKEKYDFMCKQVESVAENTTKDGA